MKTNPVLRVDPEFRDKIPPLTADEFSQLEQNIVSDGEIYEPIITWNGAIVDGHNRYKIAQMHPEIPFTVKEMYFPDKWAAFDWMYSKQLGRRNLTDEHKTYCIGKMYEARKKSIGGDRRSEEFSARQNVRLKTRREIKNGTAGEIGKEFGIDARSVHRAEKFAKGVDAIREQSTDAADKILSGKTYTTKTAIQEFTQLPKEEQKDFVKAVETGKKPPTQRNPNSNKGYTKADRVIKDKVEEAYASLMSKEEGKYTLDILVNEMEVNGAEYVRLLQNSITEHEELMTDWNKPLIVETIDTIIKNIIEVKESIK